MNLTEEQRKQFEEAVKPLIKFLCDNCNPHVTVIVTPTDAELLTGALSFNTKEYIKD